MNGLVKRTAQYSTHTALRWACLLVVYLYASISVALAEYTITTYAGDGAGGQLSSSLTVAVDGEGNLYIADFYNHSILKVTTNGVINTVVGDGVAGARGDGGPATAARLSYPSNVAVDGGGNLFIIDSCNNAVRKVNPQGVISTIRGTWSFCDPGDAPYFIPYFKGSIAVDSEDNLFVGETYYTTLISKITPAGTTTPVAGTGAWGFSGDGGPATSALLRSPYALAVDGAGNLFIADWGNNRIRKVTSDGIISTVAGNGIAGFSGDGGPATFAQLAYPYGVAVDGAGNLFIADSYNNRIRKVTPDGIISTIAGNGTAGFSGDNGSPISAQLNHPTSVALDAEGNLYIADSGNYRVRRVTLNFTVPTLTTISPNVGVPGTTVSVLLSGTSFTKPFTVEAGSGVTVGNIVVLGDGTAMATLTIASDAVLGSRTVTVTTDLGTSGEIPFTVVPPFPDLSVTTSHVGNLAVGFDGDFLVNVRNAGLVATTGVLTLTDQLPRGLNFASATGEGWSCSSSGQIVTCTNLAALPAGASTDLKLTVAVDGNAAIGVTHAVSVSTDGDLISSSNSASDTVPIARTPELDFRFNPKEPAAGRQSTLELTAPSAFPFEVTGTLTIAFTSNAAIPVDDPAIQFATGGREVAFTIPANSLTAHFASSPQLGPIGFQVGTVAGTLTFSGKLQAGNIETTFQTTRTIPQGPPQIQTMEASRENGFTAVMTLFSTMREVTRLNLDFRTTVPVRVSCGAVTGCTASNSTLSFDVRSQFDAWFGEDTTFGSLSTLRVPLSIPEGIHGTVSVMLANSRGNSNVLWLTLP